MPTEVHPIPCTKVLAQFQHAITYRITVSKIAGLQSFEADANLGLRLLVS